MQNHNPKFNILAIETSCDETAAAVIEAPDSPIIHSSNHPIILSNIVSSQVDLHRKYGGVYPEIASRAHAEKIIPVAEEALEQAGIILSGEFASSKWVASATGRTKHSEGRSCKAHIFERQMSRDGQGKSERMSRAIENIDLIAVTTGPGLIGSLFVGVNFAKTLAYITGKPIIGINHWLGHIYSNFIGEKFKMQNSNLKVVTNFRMQMTIQNSKLPEFPVLNLIVSGGHTGLVLMKSHQDLKEIGQTLDDSAGEAFDKVAAMLGLPYPGGPAIEKEVKNFKPKTYNLKPIKLPRPMIDSDDFNFSFSGLKTAVLYKIKEPAVSRPSRVGEAEADKLKAVRPAIAAEFQQAVIDVLITKTLKAAQKYRVKSICLSGGVSANKELIKQMNAKIKKEFPHLTFHNPHLSLTTDNAAMIGMAAAYHLDKTFSWDKISADANLKISSL